MEWKQVLDPTLTKILGTVALAAIYIFLEARTVIANCQQFACDVARGGWAQFSVFPHCCATMTLKQLILEYVLLVLVPLLLSYVLVAIAVWAWENR